MISYLSSGWMKRSYRIQYISFTQQARKLDVKEMSEMHLCIIFSCMETIRCKELGQYQEISYFFRKTSISSTSFSWMLICLSRRTFSLAVARSRALISRWFCSSRAFWFLVRRGSLALSRPSHGCSAARTGPWRRWICGHHCCLSIIAALHHWCVGTDRLAQLH